MPTAYVSYLAAKGKGSVDELERKWNNAVKEAEDAGKKDNYAYITGIFKRMAGIKKSAYSAYASLDKTWSGMGFAPNRQTSSYAIDDIGDDKVDRLRNPGLYSNVNWNGLPMNDDTGKDEKL